LGLDSVHPLEPAMIKVDFLGNFPGAFAVDTNTQTTIASGTEKVEAVD